MPDKEKLFWLNKGKAPYGELPKAVASVFKAIGSMMRGFAKGVGKVMASILKVLKALLLLLLTPLRMCLVVCQLWGCAEACKPIMPKCKACMLEARVLCMPCKGMLVGCKVVGADCILAGKAVYGPYWRAFKMCFRLMAFPLKPITIPLMLIYKKTLKPLYKKTVKPVLKVVMMPAKKVCGTAGKVFKKAPCSGKCMKSTQASVVSTTLVKVGEATLDEAEPLSPVVPFGMPSVVIAAPMQAPVLQAMP